MKRRHLFLAIVSTAIGAPACSRKMPASCMDAPGLTPDEAQIRANMAYSDWSPTPDKRCESCRQYKPPQQDGACGGCAVMKGPVHPNGTCKVYGARG
jgi:hypothetical protein